MNTGVSVGIGSHWLCAGLLAGCAMAAAPAFASNASQLVVVHADGRASSFALRSNAAQASAAACDSSDVIFAFVATPTGGITQLKLRRGTDSQIGIDVSTTCSRIEGRAVISFDAGGGTAVSGSDYTSTPGVAMLPLHLDGSASSASATVSIQLPDGANAASNERTFNILRQIGSFQGDTGNGQPVIGSVPGSSTPLVEVTLLAGKTIDQAAGIINGLDPAAREVSAAVENFCDSKSGGGSSSLGCQSTRRAADLIGDPNTPPAARNAAQTVLDNNLRAISPDETTAVAFNARQLATNQQDNLAARVSTLHSRTTSGASVASLSLVNNGVPLSLGGLDSLLNAGDDDTSANQANEDNRTLLGGARWGFWVNGTLGGSDRDRVAGNSGFDSHTWSLTSGVDYRFNSHFFLGGALGYSRFDSTYSDNQGTLDADARSLHVYGGYTADSGLALDTSLSYTRSDYDLKRVVELFQLSADGTSYSSLGRDIAHSSPAAGQLSTSLGVTYTIMRGTWTFSPQAQVLYLRSDFDAFAESGPSSFNLAYPDRSSNGTSLSAGVYVDKAFATTIGAFRPYSRLLYYSDRGSTPDLFANFVTPNPDGGHTSLRLTTEQPDRLYGTIEIGLGFSRPIGTRTWDFNFAAMQLFDSGDLSRWALRLDMRVPF